MPLNTLRLNHQKSSHPNDRIVFIKPIPRAPSAQAENDLADTFLRAIAAQCLPLMKKHYLSVTTLEEYEPNREFIGRNFNNGEVIQLVLRSKNGAWMPFNMVQMVMMHELAHNSHMNHGKLFWQTRNLYAGEMKALWDKGYTGEGFWGSGRTLDEMGNIMGNNILHDEELAALPLCGGTYRSRRRKRKTAAAPDLTWKEKRDRRIEKKFGKNGVSLGEDEDRRIALEINRKGGIGSKPRIAQSKRGRELRAAAALARFGPNKSEVENLQKRQAEGLEGAQSEFEDEEAEGYGDMQDVDQDQADALDVNGQRLLDRQGGGMVRVCDDEDTDDINVKQEMTELESIRGYFKPIPRNFKTTVEDKDFNTKTDNPPSTQHTGPPHDSHVTTESPAIKSEIEWIDKSDSLIADISPSFVSQMQDLSSSPAIATGIPAKRRPISDAAAGAAGRSSGTTTPLATPSSIPTKKTTTATTLTPFPEHLTAPPTSSRLPETSIHTTSPNITTAIPDSASIPPPAPTATYSPNTVSPSKSSPTTSPTQEDQPTVPCVICSLDNPHLNATCLACAHVLDIAKDPRAWSCTSTTCQETGSRYLNSGDAGICGVCGQRRLGS